MNVFAYWITNKTTIRIISRRIKFMHFVELHNWAKTPSHIEKLQIHKHMIMRNHMFEEYERK